MDTLTTASSALQEILEINATQVYGDRTPEITADVAHQTNELINEIFAYTGTPLRTYFIST